MTDFNIGNNFNIRNIRSQEVMSPDAEVAYVEKETEDLKAQTDLSLDPSAVIGKSQVVDKTPKYDTVLLESILKFLRHQPGAVEAFNDAYDVAIEAGYPANVATALAEEALEKFCKNVADNSQNVSKDGFDF